MQGLAKIHALAAAAMREGLAPDWQSIRQAVLRSKPPYADALEELIGFVATRSGGVEGNHLPMLHAFHRQFVNPRFRSALPPPLYRELSEFQFHFVSLAIWKAAYTCPIEHVKKGVCSWISASEVASLAKAAKPGGDRAEDVRKAEGVLLAVREVLDNERATGLVPAKNTSVPRAAGHTIDFLITALIAKLDINMSRYLLKKQDTSKAVLESEVDVAREFQKSFKDRHKIRISGRRTILSIS